MASLKKIPTPPDVLWREFRIRFLPIFAFAAVLVPTVLLWDRVGSAGFAALAEGPALVVRVQQAGVIEKLLVEPNQPVEEGQVLAILRPYDIRSVFDRLQLEVALQRLRSQPSAAEENAMGFERIRVELLRTESELEIARVRLAHAQREAERGALLHRDGLLAQAAWRELEQNRDALQAEVQTKQVAVTQIRGRLTALETIGTPGSLAVPSTVPLDARVEKLLQEAQHALEPVAIVAPRSGVVRFVARHAGETLEPGEEFIGVTARRSDRIVSYLRQPYPVEIEVGMPVEVSTRERRRRIFQSYVTHVGARVEAITNSLAQVRPNALFDAGLPFVVSMPAHIDVRPGELLDIRFDPPPAPTPAPGALDETAQP